MERRGKVYFFCKKCPAGTVTFLVVLLVSGQEYGGRRGAIGRGIEHSFVERRVGYSSAGQE